MSIHPRQRHRTPDNSHGNQAPLGAEQRRTLVQQWASLLSDLAAGSPSISTSAEQMAEDLPRELVSSVNAALRQQGCRFQVQRPSRRRPTVQSKRRREDRGSARPALGGTSRSGASTGG